MRIVIVGGSSTLGTALKNFLAVSHQVYTAGRSGCDIHLDLSNIESEFILPAGIDVVVHTAAAFDGKTAQQVFETEKVNVLGTLKVWQASHNAGVKHFVFISSIFAESSSDSHNYGIYSVSKRHAEEVLHLSSSDANMLLTILRPAQIYGTEPGHRRHQPFFFSIIEKAAKGEDIFFYGSKDPVRNFIHISDVVRVLAAIIEKRITGNYNCCQLSDTSYEEIARTAINVFGSRSQIHYLTDKQDIPDNVFIKEQAIFDKTGVYPQVSLEDGIIRIGKEIMSNS